MAIEGFVNGVRSMVSVASVDVDFYSCLKFWSGTLSLLLINFTNIVVV